MQPPLPVPGTAAADAVREQKSHGDMSSVFALITSFGACLCAGVLLKLAAGSEYGHIHFAYIFGTLMGVATHAGSSWMWSRI